APGRPGPPARATPDRARRVPPCRRPDRRRRSPPVPRPSCRPPVSGAAMRAEPDIDLSVADPYRMGAKIDRHGRALRIAAGNVKAALVQRALDDLADDEAVGQT